MHLYLSKSQLPNENVSLSSKYFYPFAFYDNTMVEAIYCSNNTSVLSRKFSLRLIAIEKRGHVIKTFKKVTQDASLIPSF